MRKHVFRHPDTFQKYEKCLDEIEIWAKWEDKLPLVLASQVYYFISVNAKQPYMGLELKFMNYFEANHTAELAEYFLDDIRKKPDPKGIRRRR